MISEGRELLAQLRAWWASVYAWLAAQQESLYWFAGGLLLTLLAVLAVRLVLSRLVLPRVLRRGSAGLDQSLLTGLQPPVSALIFLIGLRLSLSMLKLPGGGWGRIFSAFVALNLFWAALRVVGVLDDYFRKLTEGSSRHLDRLLVDLLSRVTRIAVWLIGLTFVAQNLFQLDVAARLAGAGGAGVAIAFAAQNTIANLFGTITIVSDRPFTVGDRVRFGEIDGVVEAVGLRSTSIRSLDGTLWCVPNRQISDSAVENISSRPDLKHVFTLNLVYTTTPEQMRRAVAILHELIDHHPGCAPEKPPLIHFTTFQSSSLDISVVMWFAATDFPQIQNWKQELNLAILERFNAEGLDFAYPTTTIYLKEEKGNS